MMIAVVLALFVTFTSCFTSGQMTRASLYSLQDYQLTMEVLYPVLNGTTSNNISSKLLHSVLYDKNVIFHFADFDGDGNSDLLLLNEDYTGHVCFDPLTSQHLMPVTDICSEPQMRNQIVTGRFYQKVHDEILCISSEGNIKVTSVKNSTQILYNGHLASHCNQLLTPYDQYQAADVNHDGLDDLICHNDEGLYTTDNNFTESMFFFAWCGPGAPDCVWFMEDFNGDGIDDLFGSSPEYVWVGPVLIPNHFDFVSGNSWLNAWQLCPDIFNIRVGFFNRDNFADVLCYDEDYNNVTMYFGQNIALGKSSSKQVSDFCIKGPNTKTQLFVADLNGDNITDIICFKIQENKLNISKSDAPKPLFISKSYAKNTFEIDTQMQMLNIQLKSGAGTQCALLCVAMSGCTSFTFDDVTRICVLIGDVSGDFM